MKLGRYENDKMYMTFERVGTTEVAYTWGYIGFPESGSGTLTNSECAEVIANNHNDGFIHVDFKPLSEGAEVDNSLFLDWVGGITR